MSTGVFRLVCVTCVMVSINVRAQAQDLAASIHNLRISQGRLPGIYRMMKNDGRLNWYLCNLGLLPLVDSRPVEVRDYLDLYLKNTDKQTGAIEDYIVSSEKPTTFEVNPTTSDSDDAYAGTFLSLAARYYKVSKDKAWWGANVKRIKEIADLVLVDQRKPSGLITTFVKNRDFSNDPKANDPKERKQNFQNVSQLMDNCEVYKGLIDFAEALTQDDDCDGAKYDCAAKKISKGIDSLYDAKKKAFRVNDASQVADTGTFYANRACQAFPELYNVPLDNQKEKYDAAWAYLNGRIGDDWAIGKFTDGDESVDGFPWMTLGYAAAKRGDKQRAVKQLQYFMDFRRQHPDKPVFTAVHELGFAIRIQQQLAKPKQPAKPKTTG